MKVLHLSTPTSWRGGEQQVAYLAKALSENKLEQIVLSPQGSELSKRLNGLPLQLRYFQHRGLLDFALARRLTEICRSESVSLVHCHDSRAHSAAVMAATFYGNSTPLVVSRRVDFAISPTPFSRWKYNHKAVKRIICVSEKIRELTAPGLRDPSRLRVVHSGIDTDVYNDLVRNGHIHRELGLESNTPLVGNLSALADHKDYPTFLRTAAKLVSEGFDGHFIIAGSGPEEADIRSLINTLKLEKRVHLLGFRKDVAAVMKELDLFLMTSVTEGLGTIVIEALAAGVPVVATRAGGIPELILHEQCGLLADPSNVAELSRHVLRIFGDSELRLLLNVNGKLRAAQFSYRKTAAATLDIYREVLSSSRG